MRSSRPQTLTLLLRCWLRFLVTGTSRRKVGRQAIRKVLIVQMAKMGDMVCTTPVFAALKKHLPGVKVHVLGNAINKEVLAGHPHVDAYHTWTDDADELIRLIRTEHFDAACISTPGFVSLVATYLAGVPLIVAPTIKGSYSPLMTRSYRLALPLVIQRVFRSGEYLPRGYLRLLEPLGIGTDNTTKSVTYTVVARDRVVSYLRKHEIDPVKDFIVLIAPSAGNAIKAWPSERFAKVAEYLRDSYGARIIVLGAKGDKKQIARMMDSVGNDAYIVNALDAFSIEEIKAVIGLSGLLIASDTGPIYIAEALGIPTIDIVGPVDEREQPPIGEIHKVVVPPDRKKPALPIFNSKQYDASEVRRQAESITVESVVDETDALLKTLGRRKLVTDRE